MAVNPRGLYRQEPVGGASRMPAAPSAPFVCPPSPWQHTAAETSPPLPSSARCTRGHSQGHESRALGRNASPSHPHPRNDMFGPVVMRNRGVVMPVTRCSCPNQHSAGEKTPGTLCASAALSPHEVAALTVVSPDFGPACARAG